MQLRMDWQGIHFDWNRAKAFLVTAEEGSLSAAGRALKIAQPTIGRQISALEEELGVVLFQRVGNRLELTPTGADLVEQVRAMSDAAYRFSLIAAGHSLSLEGTVCISASQITATHLLPRIIASLRSLYPGIAIEIVATNETSDLNRREADIAIRSFRPQGAELIARKIGDSSARLYATPGYLETLGNPTTPDELSRGDFINFNHKDALMNGLNAIGLSLTPESFPLVTENQLVQWELTKQGVGISIMDEGVGEAEPLVVQALPQLPPISFPTWLTTHKELRTNRRIRVVFDYLYAHLGDRVTSEMRGAIPTEG